MFRHSTLTLDATGWANLTPCNGVRTRLTRPGDSIRHPISCYGASGGQRHLSPRGSGRGVGLIQHARVASGKASSAAQFRSYRMASTPQRMLPGTTVPVAPQVLGHNIPPLAHHLAFDAASRLQRSSTDASASCGGGLERVVSVQLVHGGWPRWHAMCARRPAFSSLFIPDPSALLTSPPRARAGLAYADHARTSSQLPL